MRPSPSARIGGPIDGGLLTVAARRAGARGGIAPAHLLDVQTAAGDFYYWSDRPIVGVPPVLQPSAAGIAATVASVAWDSANGWANIILTEEAGFMAAAVAELSGFTTLAFLNGASGKVSFYESDGRILKFIPANAIANADVAITEDAGTLTSQASTVSLAYKPWLLDVAQFTFNRTMQTDTGSLTVQNLSGDVLQSDFERIVRRSTLEGALAVYRYFSVDMQWAWIEQHGTISVGSTPRTSAQLSFVQLLQGQDDTPEQQVGDSCQIPWAERRCGASGFSECLYTYESCQNLVSFTGYMDGFQTNNPATAAVLPGQLPNRTRPW